MKSYQSPNTFEGIHFIKFTQVTFMISSHCLIWMISSNYDINLQTNNVIYPFLSNFAFISFVQLSLPITAGLMLRHRLKSYYDQGRMVGLSIKSILPTIFMLIFLESLCNVMTYGFDSVFDWDVLKFISLSFLIIIIIVRISVRLLLIFLFSSLFMTPIIGTVLAEYNHYIVGILIGDDAHRFYWPLFPWFSTVAFGFLLYHFFLETTQNNSFMKKLLLLGCSLLILYNFTTSEGFIVRSENIWHEIFRPNLSIFFGIYGLYLLLFYFSHQWLASRTLSRYSIIRCYSSGILWIYMFHSIFGYNVSQLLKTLNSDYLLTKTLCLIVFSIFFSWLIGYICIKIFYERKYTIYFSKT